MKRVLLVVLAIVAGVGAAELVWRWPAGRAAFEQMVAQRAGLGRADKADYLPAEKLRSAAASEVIAPGEVEAEMARLRAQFADESTFANALHASSLTLDQLRNAVEDHLRERNWLEQQIAPETPVSDEECRQVFEAHRAAFVQPLRYRVSHIFVAAPDGTSPEVIAQKQGAAQALSMRLLAGESFAAVAAEASEDEATKGRGGDLGYIAAARVPPEFWAELQKLAIGETSAPVRSHLGFHILQVSDVRPARQMTFEEARAELAAELANRKRAAAVVNIAQRLRRGN